MKLKVIVVTIILISVGREKKIHGLVDQFEHKIEEIHHEREVDEIVPDKSVAHQLHHHPGHKKQHSEHQVVEGQPISN